MYISDTDTTIARIKAGSGMSLEEIIKIELDEWESSKERRSMIEGVAYYRNETSILNKINKIQNRSNVKLVHGYAKMLTDQKIGYLLSLRPTIKAENNEVYQKHLDEIFNMEFLKQLKNIGKDAVVSGKGWQIPTFKDKKLVFKRYKPYEIKPIWKDEEHTELDGFIRPFTRTEYEAGQKKIVSYVDFCDSKHIWHYKRDYNVLRLLSKEPHFKINDKAWSWNRVPLICWKYNDEEVGLVEYIKSLIDDYDNQSSKNSDVLADLALIVYVLKGYMGEDLGEFLENLRKYMAVKINESEGGVDTIQVTPETAAVEATLERTRKNIINFGRGVDTQDKDLGNASGVALKFRYGDLDLDCNMIESEFQSSFEAVEWFIKEYLYIMGLGDFRDQDAQIIFNRDVIINEKEVIEMCEKSRGIISDQTIRENHPWAAEDEDERVEKERKEAKKEYEGQIKALGKPPGGDPGEK